MGDKLTISELWKGLSKTKITNNNYSSLTFTSQKVIPVENERVISTKSSNWTSHWCET